MTADKAIEWQLKHFTQLSTEELYQILKLRVDVFVVEQNCPYPELDNKDLVEDTLHLIARKNNQIVAYSRLLPPGCSYQEISIGRVISSAEYRNLGLGRTLMAKSIEHARQTWPGVGICIGAQSRLHKFYKSFGFQTISKPYMEDGIEHVEMLLPADG